MLGSVRIQNYKSIRDLSFRARRVNLFIGEPNSGKSNLLEALAVFSQGVFKDPRVCKEVLRFRKTPDLFFDREVSKAVTIKADTLSFSLRFEPPKNFIGFLSKGKKALQELEFTSTSLGPYPRDKEPDLGVAYYKFKPLLRAADQLFGKLQPPYGSNLVALIASNHVLRRRVSDLFRSKGFRLQLDSIESELSIAKDVDDQLFKYSYESVSETLRRVVFYMAILETSERSTLLLDEPEANTFPFYTTYLAERIALDESNQFFITTHNPYILSSIVGKTQVQDLAVFVTEMKRFETSLTQVPTECLPKILDYGPDAFLNMDKLLEA